MPPVDSIVHPVQYDEVPSACEESSVGDDTASTNSSEEEHLRSVKDYRTVSDLKLALTCGSFLHEQKKRAKRGDPSTSKSQGKSLNTSIPDLQHSSDDDLYDDTDYSDDFSDLEEELSKDLDPEFDWVVQDLDMNSSVDQTLEDELYRLKVLRSYFILDNKPEDLLIVKDASKDIRFKDNSLVSQPPHIRFYGGAPLICPEGVKLGTFCVLDTVARPNGLSLEEKHSLRELAEMTVEMMVERRNSRREASEDKSKMIACTAHDLLTPLSGVQMSVSLLKEDERLAALMDDEQKEILETAENCSEVLSKICHETIETFRAEHNSDTKEIRRLVKPSERRNKDQPKLKHGHKIINVQEMVNNISVVMDTYPKNVPLYVTIDPNLPTEFVSNELKVFRSVVNYLTNACKHTQDGCIHFKVTLEHELTGRKKSRVVFQVEDTGMGVPPETYPNLFRPFRGEKKISPPKEPEPPSCLDAKNGASICRPMPLEDTPGLGLCSVATNIGSLNGDFGFRPRSMNKGHTNSDDSGSIFWFSIPLIEAPAVESNPSDDTVSVLSSPPAQINTKAAPSVGSTASSKSKRSKKMIMCKELPAGAHSKSKSKMTPRTEIQKAVKRIAGGTWNRKKTHILLDESDDEVTVQSEESIDLALITKTKVSKKKHVKTLSVETLETESKVASESVKVKQVEATKPVSKAPRKAKVLIIDDSLVIRKSVARAFATMGYDVEHACNGHEGLERLKAALFDVVFCDFLMPIMDGLDCIQQYRAWESQHRPWFRQYVMGISAHANKADVERALDVGMDDFRPKPLPLDMVRSLASSDKVQEVGKMLDRLVDAVRADLKELERANSQRNMDTAPQPTIKTRPSFGASFKMPAPIALLVMGSTANSSKQMTDALQLAGWKVLVAQDGEHALKELKQRNFDAVFVDDSEYDVVKTFRDWENSSRITKQRNVVCLCRKYVAPPPGAVAFKSTSKPYPPGFDAIIAKPVQLKDLTTFLQKAKAERLTETSSKDILLR